MFGLLMMLMGLAFVGVIVFSAFILAMVLIKATVHVVLLPLKLIFLPFLAVLVLVKIAILLTVGAVVFAILLPLLIVGGLLAAPFLLLHAIF